MLQLRCNDHAPRRPPRILVVGPPGSGRYTQAKLIAENFGVVFISIRDILHREIQSDPDLGKVISDCLERGDPVPDNIINFQVEKRLKQSDCKVNGWVLEGFPYTRPQMNMLKALRIRPSHTFVFEM